MEKITKTMTNRDPKAHPVLEWFGMTEDQVLERFGNLKDAQTIGKGNRRFVFIPGTREDRACLVAHSDTVPGDGVEVGFYKGHYFSLKRNKGIGADDRAGCSILWDLKDSGHSLLIPAAEESGCQGSRFLVENDDWKNIINEHRFLIEFDRMNANDLAFYDVGSDEFKDWCEKQFKGYKRTYGSSTDIRHLCVSVCGVNISVGYYGQHCPSEYLVAKEFNHTLEITKKVLAQKDLPRFPLKKSVPQYMRSYNRHSWNDDAPVAVADTLTDDDRKKVYQQIIMCPHCDALMDATEFKANTDACTYCNKGLEANV